MKKCFFVAHPIAIPAPIDYDITHICMDINYTQREKKKIVPESGEGLSKELYDEIIF